MSRRLGVRAPTRGSWRPTARVRRCTCRPVATVARLRRSLCRATWRAAIEPLNIAGLCDAASATGIPSIWRTPCVVPPSSVSPKSTRAPSARPRACDIVPTLHSCWGYVDEPSASLCDCRDRRGGHDRCCRARPMRRPNSPASGSRAITRISRSAFPDPSCATTSACRSTTRRGSSPTAGTRPHHASRRAVPRPRVAVHPARADESADLGGEGPEDAGRASRSSSTAAPTSRRGRSGWTGGRIRVRTRRTPGWASRPAAGTATCSSSRRRTSSRAGYGATASPMSDRATMTEYFVRNGDMMTHIVRPRRSGVPHRAAGQEPGVHARRSASCRRRHGCGSASRWSRSPRRPKATCRRTCPASIPFKDEFDDAASPPGVRRRAAAPRRCIRSSRRAIARVASRRIRRPGPPACGQVPKDAQRDVSLPRVAVAWSRRTAGALVGSRGRAAEQNFDAVQMDIAQVSGNVYMLVGAGGNTTVFTRSRGRAGRRHAVRAAQRRRSSTPSRS